MWKWCLIKPYVDLLEKICFRTWWLECLLLMKQHEKNTVIQFLLQVKNGNNVSPIFLLRSSSFSWNHWMWWWINEFIEYTVFQCQLEDIVNYFSWNKCDPILMKLLNRLTNSSRFHTRWIFIQTMICLSDETEYVFCSIHSSWLALGL